MTGEADHLAALEALVGPPEQYKGGWLGPAYKRMAHFVSTLTPERREATERALERWLEDEESHWHRHAALTLAQLLASQSLFAAAVRRARALGVHDSDDVRVPAWWSFHRHLIAAVAAQPVSPVALHYLDELADDLPTALGAWHRDVAGAAWLARCQVVGGPHETACLAEGLRTIRSWSTGEPDVSLTGLVYGLYAPLDPARRDPALALLTDEERRRVEPQPA